MQLYRSLIIFIIAIAMASSSRIDAANAQVIPRADFTWVESVFPGMFE
jgi:hypothetical protein